ncbi:MAG TPA: hypothetical protein VNV87_20325, partial [Acidimicrobiales bacterium]|nr:hypothetical protein [Acidimicrobiales bacterium]
MARAHPTATGIDRPTAVERSATSPNGLAARGTPNLSHPPGTLNSLVKEGRQRGARLRPARRDD